MRMPTERQHRPTPIVSRAGVLVVAAVLLGTSLGARAAQQGSAPSGREADKAPALSAVLVLADNNRTQLEAIDSLLSAYLAPSPSPSQGGPFPMRNGSISEAVFESVPLAVLPGSLPPTAIPNLLGATRDDDGRVRAAAAFALGVLASPAMGPRPADVEQALVSDFPLAMRHPDAGTREALIRAAARIFEPPPHASAPSDVADAVIAALNDPDTRVRLWASDTLGWLRERRAAPALRERFAYYRSGDEALAALHALARIGMPDDAPLFREQLMSRQAENRVMALEGLGRAGDSASVPMMTTALNAEHETSVLLAGSFAFTRLGGLSNLDTLLGALQSDDTQRQARVYVTELGPAAAPALRGLLQHGTPAARLAAAEMLGLCGDPTAAPLLETATRDGSPGVAEAARQALIRLRAAPAGARVH